jgi:hypothetical protein
VSDTVMLRVQHPRGDVRVLYLDGQYEVWNTVDGMEYFVARTSKYPRAKDAAILATDNERGGSDG